MKKLEARESPYLSSQENGDFRWQCVAAAVEILVDNALQLLLQDFKSSVITSEDVEISK